MNYLGLSKTMSYALRHGPAEFGLTLDKEGWTDVENLLEALSKKYPTITREDIKKAMRQSNKTRFQMSHGRIRAYYGHSVDKTIEKEPSPPPEFLYHGTSPEIAKKILADGMKKMTRQRVHLSSTFRTAMINGKRKSKNPQVLLIHAKKAHDEGTKFYLGNEDIWLADFIDPKYIQ